MSERTDSFLKALREEIDGRRFFREIMLPQNAYPVAPQHPDEKIAAIGKAYEELLEHPLVKRFLRKKPKLYLWKEGFYASDCPAGMLASDKVITLSHACIDMPPRELKALLAHEIGHALVLHGHLRRIEKQALTAKEQELSAEKLAVVLSGDPEACKNRYMKLVAHNDLTLDQPMSGRGDQAYPSPDTFYEFIDEIAKRMETPEGKRSVEKEIENQLLGEYQALFPHHFNRAMGNIRA
ncbi:MAG: hypothetical protein KGJ06_04020 [Pseudomonadota bacterium]|nr:hypothetical protein [Pseudomonadota bacterium]